MRKICTFTQTYSTDREELYKYHDRDIQDINFRNQFDVNLYSFHNSTDEFVSNIINTPYFKQLKNLKIARYNNISYTKSFEYTLNWIAKNNYDYLIFLQDDCLTKNNINSDLVNFIKTADFEMLNLETNSIDLEATNKKACYETDNITITTTDSNDFIKSGLYSFDDGAYVAKVDFLITNLYDKSYYDKNDVWSGETYLEQKIRLNPIQRLTSDNPPYCRYNILGKNNWNRQNLIIELEERFKK